jgi:D-alanyl-D-alanine carboxypeptidase
MNKGERRRNRRRYRVRYDRIVIMVLVAAVVIVLVSSCVIALTKKNDKPAVKNRSRSSQTTDTTLPSEAEEKPADSTGEAPTEAPKPQEEAFVTESHEHDDIYKGNLVLVNADYEYKFIDGDVDPITLFDNRNDYYDNGDYVTKLDREVLTRLNAMMEAYATASSKTSTDIFILDGYRTYDEQLERHSSGKSRTFEAGHSDYHTGRTFDMFRMSEGGEISYFAAEGDCEWFADNAAKFGFVVRYPDGKDDITGEKSRGYTYRYVGTPHAEYMNSKGICLEEYIAEVKKHTKDEPLEITTAGGTVQVYYVSASAEGATDVPVPNGKAYTVSGNNIDGFIVTVTG